MRSITAFKVPALAHSPGVLAFVIIAALAAGLRSPAETIRLELEAAAAEFDAQLLPAPSATVLNAMRRDFYRQNVSIAVISASTIAVTLRGVSREICVDALAKTRRLEGPSVIALQGYRMIEDCQGTNEMTWWIMP